MTSAQMINEDIDSAITIDSPPADILQGFLLGSYSADLCTQLRGIPSRISYAAMACICDNTVPQVSILTR